MNISLGCGKKKRDGFVGLDSVDFGWNIVWDAEKDAIPFEDSSVSFIEAHNFFEHIDRRHWRRLFNECHRALKPNGIMEMLVPDAEKSIALAFQDITHVSVWVMGTFKYLTGERPRNADYGFLPWDMVCLKHYNEVISGGDDRVIFAHMKPRK